MGDLQPIIDLYYQCEDEQEKALLKLLIGLRPSSRYPQTLLESEDLSTQLSPRAIAALADLVAARKEFISNKRPIYAVDPRSFPRPSRVRRVHVARPSIRSRAQDVWRMKITDEDDVEAGGSGSVDVPTSGGGASSDAPSLK